MKKALFILFFIPLFVTSQKELVSIKGDTLFMLNTEVSNEMYQQFLINLPSREKLKNLPDTSKWITANTYCEPFKKYYFRHPAYANYPVVNITYQNALNFCKWKTKELNNNKIGKGVIVRLPTEKEWEFAARGGINNAIYPWGTEKMRVEKGRGKGLLLANYSHKKGVMENDITTITAIITSFSPNNYGLYNMSGNVEEMVSEKGITKGGSWKDRANLLKINTYQIVKEASPEVGFRYVVEVIEKGELIKKTKLGRFFQKIFKPKKENLSRS